MIGRHWSGLVAALAIMGATVGCGGKSGGGAHLGSDCSSAVVATPGRIEAASTDVIAFVSDRDGNGEIYTMGPDGSELTRLTHSTTHEVLPAWSPDGTRIAFVSLKEPRLDSESSIMVMNADGTNLTEVATTERGSPFTWSPDGQRIAYASFDDDIHVIDVADGRDQPLTSSPGFDGWPTWSPDGTRIVFTSNRAGTDQLWMMKADGSEPVVITTEQGEEASWSPKGDKIAFASTRDGEPGSSDPREWNEEIYVMDPDGDHVTRLTTLPGNDHWPPSWSPDGTRIAFTSDGCSDNWEIYTMGADGSALANLTNHPAHDAFPAWRPSS